MAVNKGNKGPENLAFSGLGSQMTDAGYSFVEAGQPQAGAQAQPQVQPEYHTQLPPFMQTQMQGQQQQQQAHQGFSGVFNGQTGFGNIDQQKSTFDLRQESSFNFVGIRSISESIGTGTEDVEKTYEYVNSIIETLNNKIKAQPEHNDLKTHRYLIQRVLSDQMTARYSGIVIGYLRAGILTQHILFFESTNEYPQPNNWGLRNNHGADFMNYGYTGITSFRVTPGEGLDAIYVDSVSDMLARETGVPFENIRSADGQLIPNDFKSDDTNRMKAFVINAFDAINIESQMIVEQFGGHTIQAMLGSPDNSWVIEPTYDAHRSVVLNAVGLPVRTDIKLKLKIVSPNRKYTSANNTTADVEVITVSGYIDFLANERKYINGILQNQKFSPNFVITGFTSANFAMTPHIILLGLATTFFIAEDDNWLQTLLGRVATGKNEIDYNNLGNLNIEANLGNEGNGVEHRFGTPVNTAAADFTPLIMRTFLNGVIEGKLTVAVDIPTAGPSTWFLSTFRYAAYGVPEYKARIYRALSALTGMDCTSHMDAMPPIFFPVANRFASGFFRLKGEMRDLREVDSYLGVAGFVNEHSLSQSILREYSNTLVDPSYTPRERCEIREAILNRVTTNTANIKMYDERYTFSAEWMRIIGSVLLNAGLHLKCGTGRANMDIYDIRGVDFSSAGLGADFRMFTYGTPGFGMSYDNSFGFYRQ